MFGERLKLLRNERSMFQRNLAELLNVAPSTIGMYERGQRDPDTETIKFLAEYFNVSTDWLLGRTNDRIGIVEPDEGIARDNIKYKTYQEMLNKMIELLEKENIVSTVEKVDPKEAIELIFKHGASAAIEILKLRHQDKSNKES